MKAETVTRDNATYFVITVGMSLGMEYFRQAVMDSFRENSQFPTENVDVNTPGYIKIDSSALWEDGYEPWYGFTEQVKNGLLTRLSYEFSSATRFEGDLAEQVILTKEGYVFSFHIKEYERDAGHGWEIICPDELDNVPEDEKLGRVVYLTIKPETK